MFLVTFGDRRQREHVYKKMGEIEHGSLLFIGHRSV